jgi:hypothetical protein
VTEVNWTDDEGGRYVVSGDPDLVAAFLRLHRPDLCPASGLDRQECLATICDCYYEQSPDDPYALHPEFFEIAIAPETEADE